MFVQVSRIQVYPGTIDEITNIFKRSVLPYIQTQKGFVKFHLYTDKININIIVNSYWETEENIETVFTSGIYQEQLAKFQNLFASSPIREVFKVNL
jgi:heme-degrading monooxygenase HmoA